MNVWLLIFLIGGTPYHVQALTASTEQACNQTGEDVVAAIADTPGARPTITWKCQEVGPDDERYGPPRIR